MEISLSIVADAKALIAAVAHKHYCPQTLGKHLLDRPLRGMEGTLPGHDGQPFPDSGPINHYHFVSALADAIPGNTLVSTGSSGLAVEVFYTVFRNKTGQRVFLTLRPRFDGLRLAGCDRSLSGQRTKTNGRRRKRRQFATESARTRHPGCTKSADYPDHHEQWGYASIRNTQRNYFDGRFIGTGTEAGLFFPDLEQVAETWAIPFCALPIQADLARLTSALSTPGRQLIEVVLTPNENPGPQGSSPATSQWLDAIDAAGRHVPAAATGNPGREMLIPLTAASLSAQR